MPQESFDHLKDGYLRDSWEDVFPSCERSSRKLLTSHLLRDGSLLGCAWAINYAGIRCDRIDHELGLGPWLGSMFV